MLFLGLRNLVRDPIRFLVAVLAVTFAVLLVCAELGMLLGLVRNASLLIDESRADLWVSMRGVKTLDFGTPIERRKRYQIAALPGVERVEHYNVSYSVWKLPNGANANVQVIGFDERGELAAPLKLALGHKEALHNRDAIIIDAGEVQKLGGVKVGEVVELMERKAQVVGLTQGMRSFTTTPYCFTSLRRSAQYGWLRGASGVERSFYFLVKIAPGANLGAIRQGLQRVEPELEALTREEFSFRTRKYWLIETGVGLGFLAAAVLGFAVGTVIVSQTLYALTVERLPEFGILKALGLTSWELAQAVLFQALACGALGLLLGWGLSHVAAEFTARAGTAMELPSGLLALAGIATLLLCGTASLVSVLRLHRLEPALVFRA